MGLEGCVVSSPDPWDGGGEGRGSVGGASWVGRNWEEPEEQNGESGLYYRVIIVIKSLGFIATSTTADLILPVTSSSSLELPPEARDSEKCLVAISDDA